MRFNTLTELAEITVELFDQYVAPVAKSFMSGEVPSALLTVHRTGTKENDWLAQVQFKDGMPVSTFRCTIYLEDVFRLCRRCHLDLITEDIYRVAVLYAMLHPLYQSQYNDFTKDLMLDYDSMMAGAGEETYDFISRYYPMRDGVSDAIALELFKYHMMIFSNHPKGDEIRAKLREARMLYESYMRKTYKEAFQVARLRQAQTCQVNRDGLVILERMTSQEEQQT